MVKMKGSPSAYLANPFYQNDLKEYLTGQGLGISMSSDGNL